MTHFVSPNGKSKEAITINLYGKKKWAFPDPPKKKNFLGFPGTLGHILLMDA